jgi:methionyl-tRNA synthetase
VTALETDLLNDAKRALVRAREEWEAIAPHRALEATWALSSAANTYVDRAAPWAEDKKGDRGRVEAILGTLLAVLEVLSRLIWPVLPRKSDEMRAQLGLRPVRPDGHDLLLPHVELPEAGRALAPSGSLFPTVDEASAKLLLETLTPRLEPEKPVAAPTLTSQTQPSAVSAPIPPPASTTTATSTPSPVTYEQFAAVDLRVGLVKTCERVPKKDKLLRLTVDVGEPDPRTIVAGLALSFQPEQLVGKKVVVVANLAPREFGKGLVSHGMLLATGPSEKLVLATVDGDAAPGAKLK